jgi:putative copper resistance protein D
MTTWLIITRAIHIGSCLFFFGIFAFDRFIASVIGQRRTEIANYWKSSLRLFGLVLLPIILVSGAAWFALVAMAMSGQPFQMEILKVVWTQTQFGTTWEIRLILWLIAAIAAVASCFAKPLTLFQTSVSWFLFAINAGLLGSLAWAGHGQESSPWHLFADVLHLLAAGVWPAGLLPLFLLLRKSRQIATPRDWLSIAQLVRRFSIISLAAVSLLTITGLANSWFLVGSISNLFVEPYGRWLLAKVIFFVITLAIASINLLRLRPRLSIENSQPEKAVVVVAQLQRNIQIELLFGIIIVMIVAVLGILPPAIH